jgi:ferredoxin
VTRLTIDENRCEGHARCVARAPELFDVDDEGKSFLLREDEVPEDLRDAARSAVDACPERAITVRQGTP